MITFQKAGSKDVRKIRNLLYQSWTRTYANIFSPEEIKSISSNWHSIELLAKQINDPSISFLIAKDKDKIIGMCNGSMSKDGSTLNIERLHVINDYQGKGIGSKLTSKIIGMFSKAVKVELEVEKNNQSAIGFYQKLGFKKVGNTSFEESGIKIPCFVMQKEL